MKIGRPYTFLSVYLLKIDKIGCSLALDLLSGTKGVLSFVPSQVTCRLFVVLVSFPHHKHVFVVVVFAAAKI